MKIRYPIPGHKNAFIDISEEEGDILVEVWQNMRNSIVFTGFDFVNARPLAVSINTLNEAVDSFYESKANNAIRNTLTDASSYGIVVK